MARRGAAKLAELGVGRTYQTRLLAIAANGLFRVGQWAEAEKVLDTAMRYRPSGADAVELLLARCRLWVGFGDVEAANRDLDAVATVLAGGGARHVLPMLTLRAGLAMWQGRHAEARVAVQRGLTETRSDDLVLLGVLAWHGLRAEAEAHASGSVPVDPGAVRRLKVVVDRMAARRRRRRSPGPGRDRRLPGPVRGRAEPHRGPPRSRAVGARGRGVGPAQAAVSGGVRPAAAGRGGVPAQDEADRCDAAIREAYATAQAMGARPFAAEITAVAARARVALIERATRPRREPPGPSSATNWAC